MVSKGPLSVVGLGLGRGEGEGASVAGICGFGVGTIFLLFFPIWVWQRGEELRPSVHTTHAGATVVCQTRQGEHWARDLCLRDAWRIERCALVARSIHTLTAGESQVPRHLASGLWLLQWQGATSV